MAVETPRETWTDPRIDDLSERVDAGFKKADEKMETGFREVRSEMKAGFEKADEKMDAGFKRADQRMDAGFARIDSDIRELRGDLSGLRKELLVAAVIVIAALLGLIGTHAF